MASEILKGFYLHDLLVEPLKGQVTGRSGSAHLTPKAMEVLRCLAEAPGEIVTREHLLAEVWGEGHGSPESLSHAVGEIRRALDDHPGDPRFIQTLPRRGYRLLAEPVLVTETTDSVVLGAERGARVTDIGFLENLKRRGVLETAIAYLLVGWLLIQVGDIVFDQLLLPVWAGTFVTVLVIAGFPIALVLSWYLEFRDGRAVLDQASPADARRRRFSRTYLSVIGALVVAAGLVYVYDRSVGLPQATPASAAAGASEIVFEPPPIFENSFAVLPFLNVDGGEETQLFANGLVDDVIHRLSHIPGLRVSARGDSFTLSPNTSSEQVRRRLRVQMYLGGSVEIAAQRIRVNAQLIDSATGFHVLARTFNRPREDFFQIRDEITSLTVANVRVALPPDVNAASHLQFTEEPPPLDAYLLYRRGVEALLKPKTIDTIATALGWYDAALEVDPDYAAAHAGKCAAFVAGYTEVDDPVFISNAEAACARALRLNPNLDIVHTALGDLYQSTGRYDAAEAAYLKTLEIDPSSVAALTGLGLTYQRLERLDEAEARLQKAVDVHPGDAAAYGMFGTFLFESGRFAEAAEQFNYVVALEPDNMLGVSNLASSYMLQGDFAAAVPAFQKAIDIEPTTLAYSNLGLMYYYLGDFDAAIASHFEAIELQPNDYLSRSNLGDALWAADRTDEAERAYTTADRMASGALQVNPNDPFTMMDLAWIKTALGEREVARRLIDRAKELAADDPYVHYIDGLIHNRLGASTAAIAALETAVEEGYSTRLLAGDPNLSNLVEDSRFQRVLGLSE